MSSPENASLGERTSADRDREDGCERRSVGRVVRQDDGRVGWREGHRLDRDRFDEHRIDRRVVGIAAVLPRRDPVHDVHALDDRAEDRVRAGVLERALGPVVEHDEELRSLRVRLRRAGHRDGATLIRADDRLVGDRVPRAAASGALGIATLDDEPGHEPVEPDAVVVAGLREVEEVLGRDRRGLVEEADDDVALLGGEADAVARARRQTTGLGEWLGVRRAELVLGKGGRGGERSGREGRHHGDGSGRRHRGSSLGHRGVGVRLTPPWR